MLCARCWSGGATFAEVISAMTMFSRAKKSRMLSPRPRCRASYRLKHSNPLSRDSRPYLWRRKKSRTCFTPSGVLNVSVLSSRRASAPGMPPSLRARRGPRRTLSSALWDALHVSTSHSYSSRLSWGSPENVGTWCCSMFPAAAASSCWSC